MKIEGQAIYGSSVHRVVLEFEGDPSPSISGIVKFYERDQLDLEKSFNSFQRLVEIVKEYWEQKTKTEIFNRRLASWFADYFQNLGYGEVDTYEILKWMEQSVPSEEVSIPEPETLPISQKAKTVTNVSINKKEEHIQTESSLKEEEIEPVIEEFSDEELNTISTPIAQEEKQLISTDYEREQEKVEEKTENIVEIVSEKIKDQPQEEKTSDVITPSTQKIETSEDMIKAVMERVSASSKTASKKRHQQHRGSRKPRKRQPRKK